MSDCQLDLSHCDISLSILDSPFNKTEGFITQIHPVKELRLFAPKLLELILL
jgi:hypothetical protein